MSCLLFLERSHQGSNSNKVNNGRSSVTRFNEPTESGKCTRRSEQEIKAAGAASASACSAISPLTVTSSSAEEDDHTVSKIATISSRVAPRMVMSNESSAATVINSHQHQSRQLQHQQHQQQQQQHQHQKYQSQLNSSCGASSYASSDLHPSHRQLASKASDSGPSDGRLMDNNATSTSRVSLGTGVSPAAASPREGVTMDTEISKKQREERRKAIKREFNKNWQNNSATMDKSGCNMSFVFNPWGKLMNYWSMIVCCSFIYNSWVILYRFAFDEINETNAPMWLLLDGIADLIYLCDIIINFRIGYFDEGVLQTDPSKIRQHYINSTKFYIDCLCLLPLDFLYLSIGFNSIFRTFRLIKIYRFWSFLDRTERHTNYPNVFRTLSLLHYILIMFHWNACLYQLISKRFQFSSHDWFGGSRIEDCSDVVCDYLHAFYWSTLALTLIGDLPR